MKRCGKITSSAIGKLMVSGRGNDLPSELEVAKTGCKEEKDS